MHQATGKVPACLTSLSEKLVEISFAPGRLRIFTRTCCEKDSRQAGRYLFQRRPALCPEFIGLTRPVERGLEIRIAEKLRQLRELDRTSGAK